MNLGLDTIGIHLDASGLQRVLQEMQSFADSQNTMGSSAGTTAFLRALGGEGAASDAQRAYQASLSGLGLIAGLQAGIAPDYNIGHAVDYGERLIKAIEHINRLVQTGHESQARADARNLDVEKYWWTTRLTVKELQDLNVNLRRLSAAESPGSQRFQALSNAQGVRTDAISREIGGHVGNVILPIKLALQHAWNWWLENVELYSRSLDPLAQWGNKKGQSGSQSAHTQAVEANTQALRQFYEGIFGGGRGARHAIPGMYGLGQGYFLNKSHIWRSSTFRLGAYSIAK